MQPKNLLFVSGLVAATALDERDLKECQSIAEDMIPQLMGVPTPDPALASFIAEQTQWATITDNCEVPSVTGALGKDYTSWMKELTSWYKGASDDLGSLIEACSDVPEIASYLSEIPAAATVCSEIKWAGAGDDDEKDSKTTAATAKATEKTAAATSSDDSGSPSTPAAGGDATTTPPPGNAAIASQAGLVGVLAAAGLAAVALL